MGNAISPHVDEVRLLAYADDQLAPSEAAAVGTHVLGCAGCRTRLEELRGDLEEYLRDHHAMWKRLLPQPKPWPNLAPRLERLDAPRRMPLRRAMTWAAVAAGIAVAVAAGYRLSTDRTVSAAQLLEKASAAPGISSPGRRIQIKTRGHSFTRPAALRAGGPAETRVAGVDPGTALKVLFEKANFSWQEPLSARSFARWRNQLAQKRDRVRILTGGGKKYYEVRTTTPQGVLAEAALTIRESDLHPVNETLQFRGGEWVEISGIVSEPALPKVVPPPSVASAPEPAAPVTAGPAEELRVLAALNRLGADLGEPVEVTRDAGAVRVSGLGIEATRRQQILDSLAGIPGVIVRFEEPQPVRLEAAPVSAPAAIPENALHNRLETQLGGRAMLDRFINQALDQSEAALSRAHAILNLAQRFPPAVEQSLGAADRALLDGLRRRHTAALAASSAQLAQWLAPLLPAAAPVSGAPCGVWQECAAAMLEATQVFDRELNGAIAGSSPGEPQLPELRKHLAHWQEAVAAYEASTGSARR
ncbi:MAG: zf-HC2 domain-containing protein [Bryobacteraceae bacterium]